MIWTIFIFWSTVQKEVRQKRSAKQPVKAQTCKEKLGTEDLKTLSPKFKHFWSTSLKESFLFLEFLR